jgi:hypothetical protein
MDQLKDTLKKLISSHSDILSKAELTYFKRSLSNSFRLPIFYGLPKVHKTPFSLRPVVSTTNSLLAVFSIWLDYKMKELLPLIKSYIKNSIEVINDLKNLHIPENALLFSADAISMYTNIDTASGLHSIHDFLTYNQDYIPTTFPKALFLEILETVMNNNIFSFSNTFWHQLSGTQPWAPLQLVPMQLSPLGTLRIPSSYQDSTATYFTISGTSMTSSGYGYHRRTVLMKPGDSSLQNVINGVA